MIIFGLQNKITVLNDKIKNVLKNKQWLIKHDGGITKSSKNLQKFKSQGWVKFYLSNIPKIKHIGKGPTIKVEVWKGKYAW